MSTKDDYAFTQQVGHLLRRAYQRHQAIFSETVPDKQLTSTQFVILLTVRDHPGTGIAAISHATAIDDAGVRGMVERLKWRKLVDVDHEPGDARAMKITLTDAGRAVIDETVPTAFAVSDKTLAPLGEADRATLLRLLGQIAGFDEAR